MHSVWVEMSSEAFTHLKERLIEVDRLFEVHRRVDGSDAGRRHQGLEVFNKSSIVLTCACWYNFIEDLCVESAISFAEHVKGREEISQDLKVSCAKNIASKKPKISGNLLIKASRNSHQKFVLMNALRLIRLTLEKVIFKLSRKRDRKSSAHLCKILKKLRR